MRGVVVLSWTREALPADGIPQFGSLETAGGADFRLAGLAPGSYRICARSLNEEFLDPCEWGEPIRVQIGEQGGDARAPRIALKRGLRLQLHFSDAAGLLAGPENPGATGGLLGGLWLPTGRYIPFDVKERGKGKLVFETIVPANIYLRVQLQRLGVRVVQPADTPPEDAIQALDNPTGFGMFSGRPGKPRVVRFEVQRAEGR